MAHMAETVLHICAVLVTKALSLSRSLYSFDSYFLCFNAFIHCLHNKAGSHAYGDKIILIIHYKSANDVSVDFHINQVS